MSVTQDYKKQWFAEGVRAWVKSGWDCPYEPGTSPAEYFNRGLEFAVDFSDEARLFIEKHEKMLTTQDCKTFNLSDDVRHAVCICLLHRQQSLLDFMRAGHSDQSWKDELTMVHDALRAFNRELLIRAPK